MTREELTGLLSTLDFRPAEHHPQDCLPMADAILAALPVPPAGTREAVDPEKCPLCGINAEGHDNYYLALRQSSNAMCALTEADIPAWNAASRESVADGALSAGADAIEVRKRFDVLMERMDEFYEQGMWDAQIVAYYLVQEARAALPVPREGPSHTCKECGGNLIRGDHHAACQNKARVTELTISGVTFRAVDDNHPPLCAPGKCKMESGVLPDRDVCSVCGIGSLPYPASRRMEQKAPQSVPREGEAGTAKLSEKVSPELPEKVSSVLVDVCQLLDGWHQDGTAWSEWDESVRKRVSALLVASLTASEGTSDAS